MKELRDDSSPQLWGHPLAIQVSPSETLDIVEQSQATPGLPLSGFLTHRIQEHTKIFVVYTRKVGWFVKQKELTGTAFSAQGPT